MVFGLALPRCFGGGLGPELRGVGPVVFGLALPRCFGGAGEGPDSAHGVADAGLFDLDDLGPLLAEDAGTKRSGNAGAHVEHSQPGQRLTHPGARS